MHTTTTMAVLLMALALTPLNAQSGEIVTYILTDHLGSPVIEMNGAGQVIKREVYGPYGQAQISPNNSGIGYTGHMHDGDTGLTYMQARYFDPEAIRFLSTDPVRFSPGQPNHFNPYWYAEGNPYKYTDPDGEEIVLATNPYASDVSMSDLENVVESTMSTSEVGASIVSQLAASSKIWTIKPAPSRGESTTVANNGKAGTVKADGSANAGSDGTIYLNFSEENVWISTTHGEKGSQEAISIQEKLVHEGKHAVDYANGVMPEKGAVNPSTGNPASEQRAMNVENKYRKEQNLTGTREVYE